MLTVQTPPSSPSPSPSPSTTTPHPPIDHTTLLNAFIDASRPLNDIAAELKTTVRSIADWVAAPDTQADLERLETVALARTRLLTALHLPAAVATLAALASEAAASAFNTDASPATQARAREIARKASTTLVRFARAFTPTSAPTAEPPATPTDRATNARSIPPTSSKAPRKAPISPQPAHPPSPSEASAAPGSARARSSPLLPANPPAPGPALDPPVSAPPTSSSHWPNPFSRAKIPP